MHHENDSEPSYILLLWLELRQAMESIRPLGSGDAEAVPWNCTDDNVCKVWHQLTHPKNERALWQWLSVVPLGQDEQWTQQALQECLRRKATQ